MNIFNIELVTSKTESLRRPRNDALGLLARQYWSPNTTSTLELVWD